MAGCTGVVGPPSPSADLEVDVDRIDVGEAVNFDARKSTTPDPTLITTYRWDFGDGSSRNTTQGYVSHVYDQPGRFEVQLTVINDQGGTDGASITIHVNDFPMVSISMPTTVKTGDLVELDASGSYDPEGGMMTYAWDTNWAVDSDLDGDPTNDIDEAAEVIQIHALKSGNMTGSLTITDDLGASATHIWNLRVLSRTFNVTWEERVVKMKWSGYLEQGQSKQITHTPGDAARLYAMNATLTLAFDLMPTEWPQDNFTLYLDVIDSSWHDEAKTSQENLTKNASANLQRDGMNPYPASATTYEADSAGALLSRLLAEDGSRFGQGVWSWIIEAEQADPDIPIDGLDPDEGNDWELEVEFVMLIPSIHEVGLLI
jgi:PKD repeat protein